jgi:hypothetical protein
LLPIWFVYVAVSLRLAGGLAYVYDIAKKGAKPNPITWFTWSLAGLITFAAQLAEGVGISALATLAIGVSPLVIFSAAMIKGRDASSFSPVNLICGLLAILGIMLWAITDNPNLAIIFSIIGDIFGGIPTITKVFRRPTSEPKKPYLLTMMAMLLVVLTIDHWNFATYAFPIYIFCINAIIFFLALTKIGLRAKQKAAH